MRLLAIDHKGNGRLMKLFTNLFILASFLCIGGQIARGEGSIDITLIGVTPLGGGLYRWAYDAQLSPDHYLIPGTTGFRIYDIQGYTGLGDVQQPSGWSPSDALSDIAYPGTSPDPDDPSLYNITWTWLGANPFPATKFHASAIDLGTFSFVSTLFTGTTHDFNYTGRDFAASNNRANGNTGGTTTPDVNGVSQVPVSGAHTALIGMMGSGLFWFRTRKRAA